MQSHISAYNLRDFEALRELSHPDMEVDWSASRGLDPGVYRGVEEVLRFYGRLLEVFEQVDAEPNHVIDAGDSVVVLNTAHFQGRDGIETVARSTFVFEVREGLVASICLYQGMQEALEAVGLSE